MKENSFPGIQIAIILALGVLLLSNAIPLWSQPVKLGLPVGHVSTLTSAFFNQTGNRVITSSWDGTVKIWDVASGKVIQSYEVDGGGLIKALVDPQESIIIVQSYNGDVKILDIRNGATLHTFKYPDRTLTDVVLSPSGRLLAISAEKTVDVIQISSGKVIRKLTGHSSKPGTGCFNHQENRYLSTSTDSTAKVWDLLSGNLVSTLVHSDVIGFAIFSPDDQNILTYMVPGFYWSEAYAHNYVSIWDPETGLKRFELHHDRYITSAEFNQNGKLILTGSNDNTAKIWNAGSGKLISSFKEGHSYGVSSAQFNHDGTKIVTTSGNDRMIIWNVNTNKKTDEINLGLTTLSSATFSPDSRFILTFHHHENKALLYDCRNRRIHAKLEGIQQDLIHVLYSQDTDRILTLLSSSKDDEEEMKVVAMDLVTGKEAFSEQRAGTDISKSEQPYDIISGISCDGSLLCIGVTKSIKIWNIIRRESIQEISMKEPERKNGLLSLDHFDHAIFNPTGKQLLTITSSGSIDVWDVSSGELIRNLISDEGITAKFNRNGTRIVTTGYDSLVSVWDAHTGQIIYRKKLETDLLTADFIGDGLSLIVQALYGILIFDFHDEEPAISLLKNDRNAESDKYEIQEYSLSDQSFLTYIQGKDKVTIWDAKTRKRLFEIRDDSDHIGNSFYSLTGKFILTSGDRYIKIYNAENGELIHRFEDHMERIKSLLFIREDSILLQCYNDGSFSLRDIGSGEILLQRIFFDEMQFVTLSQKGLFDASPGAMEQMYYVQGMEVIEFGQLKSRYYEPGLWEKVMSGEKLRDVSSVNAPLPLYPEVHLAPVDQGGDLAITLTKRTGGYGDVQILINGKEVSGNIRGEEADTALNEITLRYPLSNHPYLIPGRENRIEVIAYERENWLHSRGTTVLYQAPPAPQPSKPDLFVVCIGISDYTGEDIDLQYAAKDAQDMASALALGGRKLFGTDQTAIYTLVSPSGPDSAQPTRHNISAVFHTIAGKARSEDVLVVYMAGHGFSQSSVDGDYYFLTKEAYTADPQAYNDPFLRKNSTIGSVELTELIKTVPALKQVLIIDACESGKVVESLSLKRTGLSSNAIRALDRMKDRTGMHVLTGAASDAVSYEASRYGQGILTYSLLEGMRGAALRENKFVDVVNLFQYSRNRVPVLAAGIGGIQEPQLISPYGSSSFDIGILDDDDRLHVPLAAIKPVFVRSSFFETTRLFDVLGLAEAVDEMLSHNASRGSAAPYIFVDIHEYPDSYAISGGYTVTGDGIELKALFRKGQDLQIPFSFAAKTKGELLQKLFTEIDQITGKHE